MGAEPAAHLHMKGVAAMAGLRGISSFHAPIWHVKYTITKENCIFYTCFSTPSRSALAGLLRAGYKLRSVQSLIA